MRSKQYLAPRGARSPWSKLRFQRMLLDGRVAPAGVAAVERARSDGSRSILDPVERLEVPADLAAELDARPPALHNWEAFPASARRAHLAWIAVARRDETRAGRIEETVAAAQLGKRALERRRGVTTLTWLAADTYVRVATPDSPRPG